jgi:hypothetical protein
MRKHRIFGVVIAVLIGLGAFTHGSKTSHRTPGADRAGIQLASAKLPVGPVNAPVDETVATNTAGGLHADLLHQLAGQAAAELSSPFGPETLVSDIRLAELSERARTSAYLAVVAENQAEAEAKAYLVSSAANRPHPKPAAPPRAAPPPAPAPVPVTAAAGRDPWAALRQCESNGNYADDTGNGYYGAYQFNIGTWRSLGFGGLPSQAPPGQQDKAAQELQGRRGWGQWPSCARRLGLI